MHTENIHLNEKLSEANLLEKDRLEVDRVICEKGFNLLFNAVSFTATPGSAIKLNGANGSGKTTLLRSIAGLHQPESGEIRWNAVNIKDYDCNFNRQLNYLGHKQGLNADLSPLENLQFIYSLNRSDDNTGHNQMIPAEEALGIVGASRFSRIPTQMLSAGQRQRTALARLIMNPAKIWLLDEPATALDTVAIELLEKLMIKHLNSQGIIIYISHQPLDLGNNSITPIELIEG